MLLPTAVTKTRRPTGDFNTAHLLNIEPSHFEILVQLSAKKKKKSAEQFFCVFSKLLRDYSSTEESQTLTNKN